MNGVEFGEIYLIWFVCMEFIDYISFVMKDDFVVKLKECFFFFVMIDGSIDYGVIEEVIMYVCYLEKFIGRLVIVYFGI